ncbi:hypothetical protein [Arthrobacter sp. CP30]
MKRELSNTDQGAYLVTTATGSRYRTDLTSRTMSRQMGATAPRLDYLPAGFAELRRDGEAVDLLMVEHCLMGESGLFWLQIRGDHITTLRTTSPIVQIEELAAGGE